MKWHFSCPTLDLSTIQKPQPPLNSGAVKRYHVYPSQLLSMVCPMYQYGEQPVLTQTCVKVTK